MRPRITTFLVLCVVGTLSLGLFLNYHWVHEMWNGFRLVYSESKIQLTQNETYGSSVNEYLRQTLSDKKRLPTNESYLRTTKTKPVLAIAILSREQSIDKRKSVRETWVSQIYNASFDIKYVFILDRPTAASENERRIHNDIIYTNMSSELSGYANCFSTRMLIWFKYAIKTFPTAELIAKMDDDVYLCVSEIFERIFKVKSKRLYYGWSHGGILKIKMSTRVDEMFVVVGRELVERILTRKYCGCHADRSLSKACNERGSIGELISHNFADMALADWLSFYNDVDRISDNEYIVHFSYAFSDRMQFHKNAEPQFCFKKFLFHKSSTNIMYKLHHYYLYLKGGNKIAPLSQLSTNNILRDIPLTMGSFVQKNDNFEKDQFCDYWVVTIVPNVFVKSILKSLEYFTEQNWCVAIIGDQFSPVQELLRYFANRSKIIFLKPESQEMYFQTLSDALFWNHTGRRNIGYAYAIRHGAKVIFDYYYQRNHSSAVNRSLPNLKNFNGIGYLSAKHEGSFWPCSSFTFMLLPITASANFSNIYRSTIANFLQNKKISHTENKHLLTSNIENIIKNTLTEIQTLKQQNLNSVYMHLYRRGLLEYDDVALSETWISSIKTNITC